MRTPGAASSGFCRPSAVGPRLENRAGDRSGRVASYAPTAIARKQLQIVLTGQPELRDVLNNPDLRQLKQRIALRCVICGRQ